MTRPGNSRPAAARTVPSGSRGIRSSNSRTSSSVIGVLLPDGRLLVAAGSMTAVPGVNDVRKYSTWLYPSAQKILVEITSAAVAPRGFFFASNETNQVSRLASLAVKPGAAPALFSRVSVHRCAAGAGPATGPRCSSSAVIGRLPIRLVNQLESGTSSTVLMLPAGVLVGFCPDVTKSW